MIGFLRIGEKNREKIIENKNAAGIIKKCRKHKHQWLIS
jgi:hypothetical protein